MSSQILIMAMAIIGAYLIGSFPSGYIMGRLWKGIDIREVGSRSMGAMNVFYKVGFVEGIKRCVPREVAGVTSSSAKALRIDYREKFLDFASIRCVTEDIILRGSIFYPGCNADRRYH